MSTSNAHVSTFITDIMGGNKLRPSQLAKELGVSHATVGRWIKGEDIPSPKSCAKLSKFTQTPIEEVLRIAGYLPRSVN
jgi:transcriptional regulator with XRE-family HTH domain